MDTTNPTAPAPNTARLEPAENSRGPLYLDTPRTAAVIALAALGFLVIARRGMRSVLGG